MAYEIWLRNASGTLIGSVQEIQSFSYARVLNNVGAFTLVVPAPTGVNNFGLDYRVEFWRESPTVRGAALRLEFAGMIRRWTYDTDTKGKSIMKVSGIDWIHLLERRIVAYAAGSAQAAKTAKIDDLMKAIVRENLGASAVAARDWTSMGFTVQPDLGQGVSNTKGFSWRNVLTVLRDLADQSVVDGTAVYFDVEPVGANLEFRTYSPLHGYDRGPSSAKPLTLSVEFGTLDTPSLDVDRASEISYVYAGGQGEGAARTVVEVSDAARVGESAFNRCESFADARNEATVAGVTSAANAALQAGRPVKKFGGKIIDTEGAVYGVDWSFGDRVAANYQGVTYAAIIRALAVAVDETGKETVSARFETT